ncbi:MAG: hypothetical protein ABEK50_10300 [bacterium]
MSDVVYRSNVRIDRKHGTVREAHLPGKDEPVDFGVHSEIAEHYGIDTSEEGERSATLDYLVASAAG